MTTCELQLEDLEDLVGRDLEGRYLLEEFIDRGGFGAVYRGIDRKFNQPVAVKVGLSSREFMKEARLAAEVKHNNIVQVTDYGSDNGLAYLVMEYLDGETLEVLFQKQGDRLTAHQLRKFVDEIGDALAFAHADQLIHRDLKPRNIILKEQLSKSGTSKRSGRFVLLDFGIAAKLDSNGTQRNRTQDGSGTVAYMAPELLTRNPQATPLSDIYAFGVMLYQMMAGQVPFPQTDTSHIALAECLNAITKSLPPRFQEITTDRAYPVGLEELVLQCLEKDSARRPQSMAEVRQRFLEIYDASVPEPSATGALRRNPSDTGRHGESYETHSVRDQLPSSPQTSSRSVSVGSNWPWIASTIVLTLVAALITGWMFLAANRTPTYAVLTYEQGHVHGKQIDDGSQLQLEAGVTLEVTFLIEGPPGDVVHFDQPDYPDEISIETTNGPVPNKSKCFLITLANCKSPSKDLPPIVLRAKSASRTEPFEKTLHLVVKHPKVD
jgi:serine/threonine protein kinase